MNDPLSRIPLFTAGPQAQAIQALQQGDHLLRDGKYQEAVELYKQALTLRPGWGEALLALGNTYYAGKKLEEAIAIYLQAIPVLPDRVELLINLATAYYAAERLTEARTWYQKALQLGPNPGIELRLATMANPIPVSVLEIASARRETMQALQIFVRKNPVITDPYRQYGQTPFYFSYHGMNNRELHAQIAAAYLQACPSLAFTAPHCLQYVLPDRRKLRVLVISAYCFNHTVARLLRGMLEQWPRDRFDITLAILNQGEDEETAALTESVEKVIRVPYDLAKARALLAKEEADIVFYPEIGMDLMTYLLAFARLAPVQCVSWGHPDTTGIPNVDYYISTALAEPEDAQSHYSERLVPLSSLPVYYYRPSPSPHRSREALGLPSGRIYLCPQSLFKLHPDFDAVLNEILRKDDQAQIIFLQGMYPHWTEALRKRLSQTLGAGMARVFFVPARPRGDYLALLAGCDVMLDPVHFGGGNSTFEALSLGTPVITWPGAYMRGRVTLACYKAMRLMDYVVPDCKAYAARAVEVAKNITENERARLREASSVLFSNPAGINELSQFLHSAVRKAGKGEPR